MAKVNHQYVINDTDGNFYFHSLSEKSNNYSMVSLYGNTEEDPAVLVSAFFAITEAVSIQRIDNIANLTITTVLISPEDGDDLLSVFSSMRKLSTEEVMRAICNGEISDLNSLAVIAIVSAHGAVKAMDGA